MCKRTVIRCDASNGAQRWGGPVASPDELKHEVARVWEYIVQHTVIGSVCSLLSQPHQCTLHIKDLVHRRGVCVIKNHLCRCPSVLDVDQAAYPSTY